LRDGIEATTRAVRALIERGPIRWSDFDLS
jgi:hypothetical protein